MKNKHQIEKELDANLTLEERQSDISWKIIRHTGREVYERLIEKIKHGSRNQNNSHRK